MEPPLQGKMVIRAPSLKRAKSEEGDRFQLEHVMGVTLSSNAALVTDPNSHLVAYPSGCTVVLYNSATCVQQAHIINTCRKTITALAFSSDGRYLATGECGHLPYVRIWDLQDTSGSSGGTQIAEFQGHQYGINCVAFSPSNKYVVSIGSQHDMIVNVWDWKNNLKIASNKVSQKIKGVCFAQDGSYFVTVGNRHVKFWYLEYTRNTKYKEAVPLVGRAAILGSQRGQNFVAVACGRGECVDSTYVVTKSGLLCQLNNRRLLDKWLELRTSSASSMTVGEKYIFVGCAEGIVRCFDPFTLNFVTTLPRTHHLGVDVSLGTNISHMSIHPANAKYPDTVAVAYDEINHKLTSVYNDHSIYVWDVREVRRVGKSQSFLYHSACIWGIEMIPTKEEISLYRNPIKDTLPDGCFITCSSDDTIRIWNLEGNHDLGNIYSNELLKIIYMDPDLNYIKDQDQTLTGSDKVEISYDGKNGVRCIRIRPDAIHLAAGDRAGNIKIHDMRTMKEIYKIEAHDAEVLCLEYSKNGRLNEPKSPYPRLLASASRDRLIHVFNVDDHYNILQTLDDHSSSITAVRLISTATDQLKMISCGADKSIIFRNLMIGNNAPTPFVLFQRDHNVAGRTTLYDMEIDANSKHILTACQDRNVRLYSTKAGQYVRSIRGSPSEDGSLIKVTLNTSGRYMATSCTDKTLAVYCAWSGQLLACVCGHSELATGLKFTKNSDRLVSAGGDASILLWKHRQQKKPLVIPSGGDYEPDGMSSPTEALESFEPSGNLDTADYRFSVGPLPLWAKKQITEDTNSAMSLTKSVDLPKGRWAQRVEQGGISVRSVFDTDSIIAFPERQDPKPDSDGSKDSSIDSGTESRNYPEYRRESTIKFKQEDEQIEDFQPCPESLLEITTVSQSYSSHHSITMNRSHITSRHHPNTDDSSLGSMLGGSSALGGDTCEDSNADNDGDVEDCSDTDQRKKSMKLQFPEVAVDSPSEYTVNAMSVDELRKSLRKSKTKRELPLISISTTSVSGSQESDFDDDDASTPSGDNTDKNPISLLSGSTESLDTIANRGKYLQSAFDSLSGVEQDLTTGKTTLSSLHHNTRISTSGVPARNIPLVNEAKHSKYENDALGKREELNRIIKETRMKLQSVGYKSNLKSSQSVLDLSPIPEKQKPQSNRNILHGENKISLHAIEPITTTCNILQHNNNTTNLNRINKYDFNIPANINIKNNFKTLPFFSDDHLHSTTSQCYQSLIDDDHTSASEHTLYDMIINKFNEDMRHLVLQTENTDSFQTKPPPPPKISEPKQNYVAEIKQKIESNIQQVNRPKLLNLASPSNNEHNLRSNSIFKKHKSLPVSPVTEEAKLSDYSYLQSGDNVSSNLDLSSPSRQNYGFYVELGQNKKVRNKPKFLSHVAAPLPKHVKDDDEDNFSSDSLEDSSIATHRIKKYSKVMAASRRCISNYDIFQEGSQLDHEIDSNTNIYTSNLPRSTSALLKRVVTNSNESIDSNPDVNLNNFDIETQDCNAYNLSQSRESILSNNDKSESIEPYNIYPEYERHSSASFYLRNANVPPSVSQESILSNFSDSADYSWKMNEEYCLADKLSRTNCNSLESVLSDESVDTQSAPLEILFRTHRRRKISETEDKIDTPTTTKNIATTPPSTIEQNYVQRTLMKFEPEHKLVNRSKSFQEPNISKNVPQSSNIYERLPLRENLNRDCGNIPTLQNKNDQYEKQTNEFWTGNKMIAKSKSCSFEVFFDISSNNSNKTSDPYEKIPKKFTSKISNTKSLDRKEATTSLDKNSSNTKSNAYTTQSLDRSAPSSMSANKLKRDRSGFESFIGDIVKHKPPKGMRRSVSTKMKNKIKSSFDERRNSDSFTQIRKQDYENTCMEPDRSFKILDSDVKSVSLHYYETSSKIGLYEENKSLLPDISNDQFLLDEKQCAEDCYDPNIAEREFEKPYKSEVETCRNIIPSEDTSTSLPTYVVPSCSYEPLEATKIKDLKYLSDEDIIKFRDIERKIEMINKLVEIEEKKITKGKVKRLSKNFEQIALEHQQKIMNTPICRVKRNLSLPTIVNASSINSKPTRFKSKLPIKTAPQTTSTSKPSISKYDFKPMWPPATRCPKTNNLNQKSYKLTKDTRPSNFTNKSKLQCLERNDNCSVPPDDDIDSEGGLRRACSLSDLTDPSPAKQKTSNLSSAKTMHKPIPRVQQNMRLSKGTNMMRSSSVGILNQSESEAEMHSLHGGMQPPKAMPRSNLMRPTISSQNKVANTNKTNLRRRALQSSYSTANLTMVGQDDSSSDDQQHLKSNKMARNRSHSIDHTAGVGGGGNWNQIQRRNKENLGPKSRGSRNGLSDRTNTDTPKTDSDIDLANSEVTSQLCNKIAEQLTHTAENVVQLYRRLTLNETSPEQSTNTEEIDKSHMMKNLECAMLETQKILQLAVKQQQQQDVNNLQDGGGLGGGESIDVISHNNLRDLVAMSTAANSANNSTSQANVVLMMQQYSDILLNMMQQKMQQKHS